MDRPSPYTVEYLLNGQAVCWSPPISDRDAARAIALDGIARHHANHARILDGAGQEIEVIAQDPFG